MRPPTDKQLSYVKALAKKANTAVPDEVYSSADACSNLIEELLSQLPATAKQIAYAQKLADQNGVPLPRSATENSAAVSLFIDRYKATSRMQGSSSPRDDTYPSDKQLLFAISLARQAKQGLPYTVMAEKNECSTFIDKLLNGEQYDAGPENEVLTGTSGMVEAATTNGFESSDSASYESPTSVSINALDETKSDSVLSESPTIEGDSQDITDTSQSWGGKLKDTDIPF